MEVVNGGIIRQYHIPLVIFCSILTHEEIWLKLLL